MAAQKPVVFYQVTEKGAIALTQLGIKYPKARTLVDWLSMILITRNSRTNAVMVSNEVLESVLDCGAHVVTKSIKSAEDSGLLGVARYGTNKVLFINPHAIRMSNIPATTNSRKQFRMIDVLVIIDTDDDIYKSITESDLIDAYKVDRAGIDQQDDRKVPPLRSEKKS